MFAETIVGPDYLRVAGNNERYFPLMLGVFILGEAVLIGSWNLLDPSQLPSASSRGERVVGVSSSGWLVSWPSAATYPFLPKS